MKICINGMSNISPQNTFLDEKGMWRETVYHEGNMLECIHPDYRQFFKPLQLRRMSKTVKMGLVTALECLNKAHIKDPDAIIVGTGLGSMAETEKFLHQVLDRKEQMLNPSPFIYSTHNTVASQIAIHLKCHGYNATYSNNGFSFENALHDGMMLLREEAAENVLLGAIDEITEETFTIRAKTGMWKKEKVKGETFLYRSGTPGTIAGEGAAFFMLSGEKTEETYAEIKDVHMFTTPERMENIRTILDAFLDHNSEKKEGLDLVITGDNGDRHGDEYYATLREFLPERVKTLRYKHLCGDYYTASAFGLWLGAMIIKEREVPPAIALNPKTTGPFRSLLLYNHYGGKYHSFYLLKDAKI